MNIRLNGGARGVRHPERVKQAAKKKEAARKKRKPLIRLSSKTKGVFLKLFLILFSLVGRRCGLYGRSTFELQCFVE